MASLLYNVSGAAPGVLIVGSGFVFAVALLVTWLPGRRASRMNPLDALHWE